MTAHIPRLRLKLDPLITEANRRARRRRLLLSGVLVAIAAVAVAPSLALRPSGPREPQARGGGALTQSALPKDRLIVLDRSIGPVRLGESRKSVEKALGRGTPLQKGDPFGAYYFGRRLMVAYGDHGTLRPYVVSISTTWGGFHTTYGLRVGGSAAGLSRNPHLVCKYVQKLGYCISTWAWHQLYVLGHAEPSPQTAVPFRHGVITGFGIQ